MKKIILSLAMIAAMAALAVGATTAYFSDTETSSGNTFTAGAIDLAIDNTCHYDGMVCAKNNDGEYVWQEESAGSSAYPELLDQTCNCTWNVEEWEDGRPLFKLDDLKPGDWGEYTVSFHIDSNPAWACLTIDSVVDDDNTCTEPEQKAENYECASGSNGELDDYLYLTLWYDEDCDNILDDGEDVVVYDEPLSDYYPQDQNSIVVPIADTSNESLVNGPIEPGVECVGIGWRFDKDAGNDAQTDKLGAALSFHIEQARHNNEFVCIPQ
jgi:predicted ribosomally synthesized peptide with SipW-like signal peptide